MIRRLSVLAALLVVLVLAVGVFNPLAAQDDDTQTANTAAVEQLTEEFLNGGNPDVLDAIYAADAIHHSPLGDLNVEARKMTRAALGMAIPDFHVEVVSLTATEEWIAVLYTFTGTFTGELPTPDGATVPGNDAEIQLSIGSFFRFNEDGLIAESWETYDNLNLLTQMGMMPAPGGE
jgi:predicted ester cyclase